MTKQVINIGTTENDRKGDSLRAAFQKTNANFTELYDRAVNTDAQTLTLTDDTLSISGGNSVDLSKYTDTVFSGDYNDLTNKPTIPADVGDLTDTGNLLSGGSETGDVTFLGDVILNSGRINNSVSDGGGLQVEADTDFEIKVISGEDIAIWSFEPSGSLQFPDATVQTTAWTGVGDLTGSVFADDSTLLVDGVAGKIRGDIENGTVNITATISDILITAADDIDIETLGSNGDIRITASDDVTITTNNGDGGPAYEWFFGSGGYLSFPDEADLNFYSTIDGVSFNTIYNPVARPSARLTVDTSSSQADLLLHNETTVGHIKLETNVGTWIFGADGDLTFPDSTIQTTAWAGGRVVEVPTTSLGVTGDLQGDIAFNATYMYYCTQNFSGTEITMASITSSGSSSAVIIMYESNTGWTSDDLTGYTVSGPGGYTGTVTGPSDFQATTLWYIPVSPNVTQAVGDYIFTSPTGDIWKRVAWSADTW